MEIIKNSANTQLNTYPFESTFTYFNNTYKISTEDVIINLLEKCILWSAWNKSRQSLLDKLMGMYNEIKYGNTFRYGDLNVSIELLNVNISSERDIEKLLNIINSEFDYWVFN